MLPKKHRTQRKQTHHGDWRTYHSLNISARVSKTNEVETKFSFVVSGRISKKAATRNLLKRHGRSIVQLLLGEIKPSFVVIFFFKKGAVGLSYENLTQEIKNILKESNILKT